MPASEDLKSLTETLRRLFGHDNFFSAAQAEATEAVFRGNRDAYINLEPGGGKSICFQLPAMLKPGKITVVFIPTNVLAKSHTDFLEQRKSRVKHLHPGLNEDKYKNVLHALEDTMSGIRCLYASIDKSTSDLVKTIITKLNDTNGVACVVFDEAQCISKLSPDYVSDYRNVADAFKNVCPNVPKIALTGTATEAVECDIIRQLGMKNPLVFFPTSDNPLVHHDVQFLDTLPEPVEHLRQFLEKAISASLERASAGKNNKCGIIFCRTREVANTIVRKLASANVLAYHGGMSKSSRKTIEARWSAGELPVIATTQKLAASRLPWRNVDFLVHWSPPLSMHQLFHETRRFSKNARIGYYRVYISCEEEETTLTQLKSTLTPSHYDLDRVALQIRCFNEVLNYCFQIKCRHFAQRAYFQRPAKECKENCDVCCDPTTYERCAEFLHCRASLKKAIFYPPAVNKIEPSDFAIVEATYVPEPEANSRQRSSTTSMKPFSSCKRIDKHLAQNHLVAKSSTSFGMWEKFGKMSAVDISRVAYQLEFSLRIGTSRSNEYHYSLGKKVELIQACTEAKLACGFLIFTESPPIVKPKTEINDIELIHLSDEEEPRHAEWSETRCRKRNDHLPPDSKRRRIRS